MSTGRKIRKRRSPQTNSEHSPGQLQLRRLVNEGGSEVLTNCTRLFPPVRSACAPMHVYTTPKFKWPGSSSRFRASSFVRASDPQGVQPLWAQSTSGLNPNNPSCVGRLIPKAESERDFATSYSRKDHHLPSSYHARLTSAWFPAHEITWEGGLVQKMEINPRRFRNEAPTSMTDCFR